MYKLSQVILGLLLVSAAASAAAPPTRDDPKKGVVVGNAVITCCCPEVFIAYVFVHRMDKDVPVRGLRAVASGRAPVRWHVGYEAFWVSADQGFRYGPGPDYSGAGLTRLDLPSLLAGKLRASAGAPPWIGTHGNFSITSPATTYRNGDNDIAHDEILLVHYDFLPFGKKQARQFVLSNVPDESYVPEIIPIRVAGDPTPEKKPKPFPWTFTYFRYEGRWNAKKKEWEDNRWDAKGKMLEDISWKKEGSIAVGFKEPFQALALGDDFYFVTRSGSLFRAPKPAKGKNRVLARVWDGRLRPVKAFVTDAGTGKTFLFVPPAEEGGKRAFFELSDKPKLVEYDPKLVPLPPLAEPHRTVVHAARILVALKKIEGKLPAKDGEKKAGAKP
jgi:hypothetical protein